MILEGWRPDNSPETQIKLTVAGEEVASVNISSGIFKLKASVNIEADTRFRISTTTTNEVPAEGDQRHLAYIMRSIIVS